MISNELRERGAMASPLPYLHRGTRHHTSTRTAVRLESHMKQIRQTLEVQEPIGIVIADGAERDITPRFAAYVWGPAPTDDAEDARKAAAA
jgi:hypothetical protein